MKVSVHPQFKLNGISFSKEELKEVGYSLIKEGVPFEQAIGDFLLDWLNNGSEIMVRTSGSTGLPKRIALKKKGMVTSALATGDFFDVKAGDSALLCLPAEYIAGKMMLVRAMVLGLELVYVEPGSRPLGHTSKIYDFCAMVPMQLENSLKQIGQIKKLLVGGAPLSSTLVKNIQDKKSEIFETYGMTETLTHIAARKVNKVQVGTIENPFKTLSNITVSKDKRGCLVINAPNITESTIVTNDLVEVLSEKEFNWLGRYDNVINSGGVKLIPEQIEGKLSEVIDNRFFVAGLADEKLGQKLVVIVEGEIDRNRLRKKIKSFESLGKYEVPKEIFCISKFRETNNGKILRSETVKKITVKK